VVLAQEQTYLPEELDEHLVAVIESGSTDQESHLCLSSRPDSFVELPVSLSSILHQAAQAMHQGLAVTVRPQTRQLSTSQVADLLGVTRPTVVKLLESGAIPFSRVGTHRRVDLPDALRFRDSRREAQYQFIADTQVDDEGRLPVVAGEMISIRAQLAKIRRQAADA